MPKFPKLEDLSLIALDLDGTVICPQGQRPLSQRTLKAVERIKRSGVGVTFVTGRTEDYAAPIAEQFGIELPLVTYNGCRLYSMGNRNLLFQATIDQQVCCDICDWLEQKQLVVACYLTRNSSLHLVQNRCSGRPEHDDYLFGKPRHFVKNLSAEIKRDGMVSKLIVSTDQALEKELASEFPGVISAVRTHPELVDILPPGVSKGQGVLHLCQHLEVDPKRVLAIGDQANDVSTFEVCGYSIAMGDAPEFVRDAATFVTDSFEDDGCAVALERIL